jgi:branched-chain amino acid transport system ATP-binding protein
MAGTLSGGEQQMLAIARALMARPKVLLLDEPSMGLAPIVTSQIYEQIRNLNVNDGISILLVEQNARLALNLAHRGYVIETGRIVMEGLSSELSQSNEIQRAYLGKGYKEVWE